MRKPSLSAVLALAWGAAEGFLFFVVPDVLISFIALRRGLRAGAIAALVVALGAMIGGSALYVFAERHPAAAHAAVASVPAVSQPMIRNARDDVRRSGWLVAALKGPITSTPYKVYALLAPAEGVSLAALAAATIPVRLPRFLLTALAFALIGRVLEGRIDWRWVLSGFTGGWLIFYAWFWASHPG